jgi:hypothetical protein
MALRRAIWRLPDGREVVEEVEIPRPNPVVSELATRRWLAAQGKARWSDADEEAYWAEFPSVNPVTAYRISRGEVEDRADLNIDGRTGRHHPTVRVEGRSSDGARFVGFDEDVTR